MTRELRWDGLRVNMPDGMEPAVLDRGFVRLARPGHVPGHGAGSGGGQVESLELRFGPEKSPFDPDRDGRRLHKACGLPEAAFFRVGPSRSDAPGFWAAPEKSPRLFAVRMNGGMAAMLFPTTPPPDVLQAAMASLDLTPPDAWRSWRCFDLSFETPPGAILGRASFKPGSFRLEFRLAGGGLTFDRFVPADVILGAADVEAWLARFLGREHGDGMTVTPQGAGQARFTSPVPVWRRVLPWLPAGSERIRGRARHDAETNRILVVTARGSSLSEAHFERVCSSYAAADIQG